MKIYRELTCNGATMRGYEHTNSTEECILMWHGFTGSKTESNGLFRMLAERLEQKGFSILRFDWFGHGESDYTFDQTTIPLLQEQAKVMIDYAHSKYKTVYLLGFSMGGALAMNQVNDRIDKLILLAPAAFMSGIKNSYFKGNDLQFVDLGGQLFHRNFAESFTGLETIEITQKYNHPILILNGELDQAVPLEKSTYVQEQLPTSTLIAYKGADHCFHNYDTRVQMVEDITNFLKK